MDALRQERRNILAEEKRLKALLDIAKAKTKRKQDLMVAKRAEKERRDAAGKYRRAQRLALLESAAKEERALLCQKLELPINDMNYGINVGKGVVAPLGGACG